MTANSIRDWYVRGWGEGDLEVLRLHAHNDIVDLWHDVSGLESLSAVVEDLHRTLPDLSLEVDDQAGDGDRITTVWTMRGTDLGGLFAMAPTGRTIEIRAICLDDIIDGKVRRHQQVSDMWQLARQLEVIPPDWEADRPLVVPN